MLLLIAGAVFSLPLFLAWNSFRAKLENTKAAWYFGFQTTEDILLVGFFILGLAAAVSSTFLPDIYAKF